MRRLTMKCFAIASIAALTACGGSGEGGEGSGDDAGSDTGDGGVTTDAGDAGTTDGGDLDGGDPDASDTDAGDPDTDTGGPDTDAGDPDADGGTDGGDVEICDNDTDDDGDGDVDCDDADCDGDAACTSDPVCGDGTLDDGEACDDGADNSDDTPNACRTTCVEPACGDGVIDDASGETCDDANADDGDGCDTSCQVEAAFCGNGVVDEGEACDDGVENSDRIPDACRTTCDLPTCGDSVVDAGEQCDDGGTDDGDGCSALCVIELDTACADVTGLLDLAVVGTPVGTATRYVGSLAGADAQFAPPGDCVDAGATTGADQMLLWVAPADGLYVLTTEFPATAVDTVAYVLDNCVDGAPLACNDDAAPTTTGSTATFEASAGAPYFIVIDSIGVGSAYAMEIRPIDGVAGSGEACGPTIVCDLGLACTPATGGSVCVGEEAPVLEEIEITWTADGATRHVFRGTDANQDVVNWAITELVLESGAVYGDTPDEGEIALTTPPTFTFDGSAFETSFTVDWSAVPFVGELATQITAYVIDANGNESELLTADYPPNTPPTEVNEGDECDLERIANVCAAGFACTLQETGPALCGTPVAPTLDSVDMFIIGDDAVNFVFTGADPNQDVDTSRFLSVLSDVLGEIGPNDFAFDDVTYDGENYVAEVAINGLIGLVVSTVEVAAVDATNLASPSLVLALADAVGPTELALGDSCVRNATDAICGAGLACTPDAFGAATCQTAVAPVAISVEASYQDDTLDGIDVVIEGSDANADVVEVDIFVYDAEGGVGTLTLPSSAFTPDPNGRLSFVISGEVFAGGVFFSDLEVILRDATGLESNAVIDPLGAEGGLGAPCSYDGIDGACNTDEGLACGAESTCELAAAPVLTSLSMVRTSEDVGVFTLQGTDANGDVTAWLANLLEADGTGLLFDDIQLVLDNPILGSTDFTVTATIAGFSDPGFATATDVRGTLIDASGLTSESLTTAIPPVVAPGDPCDSLGIDDVCADGTSCVEGICASDVPVLTVSAAIQDTDDTRLLIVTVEGTDADEDIDVISLDFLDGLGDSAFGPTDIATVALGAPDGIDYVDGAFTATITFNWNGADVFGIDRYLVTVTDSLGQDSNELDVTFRPTVGPGDDCDLAGVESICVLGLVCDAEAGSTCIVDPVAPCGDTELLLLADVGTEVDGGIAYAYNTNGIPDADAGTCGGGGGEVAILYVADADGTLTVTTARPATTAHDSLLYARRGLCLDTTAQAACNDDFDGTLQSNIVIDVVAGESIYVFVDGYDAGGTGEVFFSFASDLVEGDPCDGTIACSGGLVCGELSATCVPLVAVGDPCDDAGLTNQCVPGSTCDAEICTALPGTCGNAVLLADVATFDEATSTWTVSGDTTGRDNTAQGSCGTSTSGDFVYAFEAPAAGIVTVAMSSAPAPEGFDTVLHVRGDACDSAAAEVACNDDTGGTRLSVVTFDAVGGTTYYLFADGFNGAAGAYDLALTFQSVVGLGEACDDVATICDAGLTCFEGTCTDTVVVGGGETCNGASIICDAGFDCVAEVCVERPGTCATPIDYATAATYDAEINGWSYPGDITGALALDAGSCGGDGQEDVFVFTATIDGFADIIALSDAFDTVLHIREGACDAPADEIACVDDAIGTSGAVGGIPITVGSTFYIFADAYEPDSSGTYDLLIFEYQLAAEGEACDDLAVYCEGDLACISSTCTALDACFDALTVVPTDATTATASFADGVDTYVAPVSCGTLSEGSDELVFEWTADVTGSVTVDSAASLEVGDTILWVTESPCGVAAELVCNDDINPDTGEFLSSVTFEAVSGTTYYFFIEEYNFFGGGETNGEVVVTISRAL